MNILSVIPARGGSKGIPQKNVRMMAGKPLISYAITCAKQSKHELKTLVTTDDAEIKNIGSCYGADVIDRPKYLADDTTTLDPVIFHAVNEAEKMYGIKFDIIITMQPTSPCLSVTTLDIAIDRFITEDWDTMISGVNDPHLSWGTVDGRITPNYTKRLNRQFLPIELRETGAFVITKRKFITETSRFGKEITVFECPEKESIDIDTPQDWCLAESELNRKKILIRLDGNHTIGMGHVYRGIQIAKAFIDHDVCFVIRDDSDIGIEKIRQSNFRYIVINDEKELLDIIDEEKANIVILDILDTDYHFVKGVKDKGVRVINFEDCGTGTKISDAVINALYEKENGFDISGKVFWGSDYYIIRDEFLYSAQYNFKEKVKEILVIFGGTDPSDLTMKTFEALSEISSSVPFHVTFILGLGYEKKELIKDMVKKMGRPCDILTDVLAVSNYMKEADLAISSQGRTMLELASIGVPTIVMAQNPRELTHEFGEIKNGFLNLGIGSDVNKETLVNTISWLISCPQVRKNMHEEMLKKDLKNGIKRVKKIILGEERV